MFYNYHTYNITICSDLVIAGVELPESYEDISELANMGHRVILSIFEKDMEEIRNISNWVDRYNQEHDQTLYHFHFTVDDFRAPAQKIISQYISKIIWCAANNYSPVTHCRGGNGRTGTMLSAAIAFSKILHQPPKLIKRSIEMPFGLSRKATIDPITNEAILTLRKKCPHSVETHLQAESISVFCENFVRETRHSEHNDGASPK